MPWEGQWSSTQSLTTNSCSHVRNANSTVGEEPSCGAGSQRRLVPSALSPGNVCAQSDRQGGSASGTWALGTTQRLPNAQAYTPTACPPAFCGCGVEKTRWPAPLTAARPRSFSQGAERSTRGMQEHRGRCRMVDGQRCGGSTMTRARQWQMHNHNRDRAHVT